MITDEELAAYAKLGLRDPREFEEEASKEPYYPRRSGRTTRMVVKAVVTAMREPVLVLGHQGWYSQMLQQDCMQAVYKLGGDVGHIKRDHYGTTEESYQRARRLGVTIFEDHFRFQTQQRLTRYTWQ